MDVPCKFNELLQIFLIRCKRPHAFCCFFLVVVGKLDQQKVALPQLLGYPQQTAFLNKGSSAAAGTRMISNRNILMQI
ncbi:hypothetical protein D3C74_454860 [compost metagenome]